MTGFRRAFAPVKFFLRAGTRRGVACSFLLLPAAAFLAASCDRHPTAPIVATGMNSSRAPALEPFGDITLDLASLSPRVALDDQAALPPGGQSIPLRAVVDDHPAWSPDGRLIAFHRRFPSSYGPPGLYVVSRHGGEPRLLLPGGFFFPREVSFSPDGRRLVCNDRNQLAFVDLGTGSVSRPMYTDNGATYPDWSPDARQVVYFRVFRSGFPPEPADSAGLHVFDVASSLDRFLWQSNNGFPSGPARWIHEGQDLAILHGDNSGWHLSVASLGGDRISRLVSVMFPKVLWNLQRFGPARPRSGPLATESLVMLVVGQLIERTLQVSTDPFVIHDRPLLGLFDALSPTGREVVVVRPDPADSLGVLYVGQADAPQQANMKQLTRYDPP